MSRGAAILCIKRETYEDLRNSSCLLNKIPVYIGYDQNYRSDDHYQTILTRLADKLLSGEFGISFKKGAYIRVTKEESSTRSGMCMLVVSIKKENAVTMLDAFRVL